MTDNERRSSRESQRVSGLRSSAATRSRLSGSRRRPSPAAEQATSPDRLSVASSRSDCSARHIFGIERTRRLGPSDHRHPCACFECSLCLCRQRCFIRVKHQLRKERPRHQGNPELDEQRLSPWDGRTTQALLAEECRTSGSGLCKVCGSAAWSFVKEGVRCFRCFSYQERHGYPSLKTPKDMLPTPAKRRRAHGSQVSTMLSSTKDTRPIVPGKKEETPEEMVSAARVTAAVARAKPRLDLLEPHEYPGPVPDVSTEEIFGEELDTDLVAFLSMKLDLKPITIDNLKVLSKKAEAWIDGNRPYWDYNKRNRMLKACIGATEKSRNESTYGLLEKLMLEKNQTLCGFDVSFFAKRTIEDEVKSNFVSASKVRNHIVEGKVPSVVFNKILLPSVVLATTSILSLICGKTKTALSFGAMSAFYARRMVHQRGWGTIFSLKWDDMLPKSI